MKKNPIKILIILVSILSSIFGDDFIYSINTDNKTPYVKEKIIVTLELNQTNKDIVLLFNFDIKKSSDYIFKRLDVIENDKYHNSKIKYIYQIYPLKSGNIDIEFNLIKKVTSDDSIAYSFSGDRDNTKILETKDTIIDVPPIKLSVKPLPKDTLIVGDFSLKYQIPKHKAKPFEPISIKLEIKGRGYSPILNSIFNLDKDTKLFQAPPKIYKTPHSTKVTYNMAISNNKSFTLPQTQIKAFNPITKKSYTLQIPKQNFTITDINKTTLLDKKDNPLPFNIDFKLLEEIIKYLLIFISGFISAYLIKLKKKKINSKIKENIFDIKDEKKLLQKLISTNPKKYAQEIDELERRLYKK